MKQLSEVIKRKRENGAVLTKARISAIIKRQMRLAIMERDTQLINNRPHRDLTEYANELIATDFKDLYNLLYDYTDNRSLITQLKHNVLQEIRVKHLGAVKSSLHNALVRNIKKYLQSSRIRKSDRIILGLNN